MGSGRVITANLIRFGSELERIPMELLLLLLERNGQLITRDEIVLRIWGKNVFLDTDNSINAAIRKIRQVLGDDPEEPRICADRDRARVPVHRCHDRSGCAP